MSASPPIANEFNEPLENETPAQDILFENSSENGLQAEIDRLTQELAKVRDQWIRAVAETDNIRKRAQRDLEENARYATSAFARDMVSVLENLKRASDNLPHAERAGNELLKTLGEGVDLTLKELLGVFNTNGIKRLDPRDAKFDHNFHQAVAQVDRDDVPAGTVVQVVQAGYLHHDRLLQPAMVVVSKMPDASKKVDTSA